VRAPGQIQPILLQGQQAANIIPLGLQLILLGRKPCELGLGFGHGEFIAAGIQ